ncbi:MAG: hypothetical protein ACHQAY_20710 [Hyphomicrobiales bacterium]
MVREPGDLSPHGSDEIDRSSPIGVFNFAESYFQAARHLQSALEAKELWLRFEMPVYTSIVTRSS